MAWVEKFVVTGLAGRSEDVTQTLNRHVNVFWGLNGAGKTTILKILHAAMNNKAADLDELPFESAEVTFRVGPAEARIVRSFSKGVESEESDEDANEMFLGTDLSVDARWEVDPDEVTGWESRFEASEVNPRLLRARFNHSYLPITRVSDSSRRPAANFETAGRTRLSSDEIFVSQVRERWRDYSTRSLSTIRDIQQQGLATVLATLFGGFRDDQNPAKGEDVEPDEAYNLVQSFLGEQNLPLVMAKRAFAEQFQRSATHRQVVSEIQEVRRQTDKVLSPQREFQRVIDSMYAGNKHLILATPKVPRGSGTAPIGIQIEEKTIPLKSLSSGEKQLLQILLETLGAGGHTVMIDEPELSMHVVWQRELVASMRRVNEHCQLFLATHSPEIMAEVPDDCVFEL